MSGEIRNPKSEIRKVAGRPGQKPVTSHQLAVVSKSGQPTAEGTGKRPNASGDGTVGGSSFAKAAEDREVRGQRSGVRENRKAEDDGEPFITKYEVASRLRKSVRTIEEWMHLRLIPFYKVGQGVRFRWSEVQAHFAKRYRVEPINEPSSAAEAMEDREEGEASGEG
jgi:excisionase family DNA binding protein